MSGPGHTADEEVLQCAVRVMQRLKREADEAAAAGRAVEAVPTVVLATKDVYLAGVEVSHG